MVFLQKFLQKGKMKAKLQKSIVKENVGKNSSRNLEYFYCCDMRRKQVCLPIAFDIGNIMLPMGRYEFVKNLFEVVKKTYSKASGI